MARITLSVPLQDPVGRCLGGTVGPEDRKDFAVSDVEIHLPHGLQLSVGFRQTPNLHRGIHECAPPCFSSSAKPSRSSASDSCSTIRSTSSSVVSVSGTSSVTAAGPAFVR